MSEFVKFTPGEYYDWEQPYVQDRLDIAAKKTAGNAQAPCGYESVCRTQALYGGGNSGI